MDPRVATLVGTVGMALLTAVPLRAEEPGLQGRADVVLQDGFEAPDWYAAWGMSAAPDNATLVSDGSSFRESSHLRVRVPTGQNYGTSFGYDFADQGLAEPDEIYFRYVLRFGPTWTTDTAVGGGGGKLPAFGGTYGIAGWGGNPSDGTNGWSARGLFWPPDQGATNGDTRLGYYVYHADMTGQYGDNWYWSGSTLGPDGVAVRDQWYQIETYVRNNTPGANDGVLRAWVDGEQVFEKSDVRFRDVDTLHVERIWFDIYYGGTWTAPVDMYLDFDNAVIAYGYIGPVTDAPPPDAGAGGAGGAAGPGGSGAQAAAGAGAVGAGGAGVSPAGASSANGDEGGCGCRVATRSESGVGWSGVALLAAGLSARTIRRRRRGLRLLEAVTAGALTVGGLACGDSDDTSVGGGATGTGATGAGASGAGGGGAAGAQGGAGGVMEPTLRDSVTQFGITWTFSQPTLVGQFVNGDYYVVGPTTISAVDPAPTPGRNGSVVNIPAEQDRTGFDDRTEANRYDPSLPATLPISLVPGDALVSTISVDTIGQIPCMFRTEDFSSSPVQTAAVLTCLAEPAPADAFRPSYADRTSRIYRASALRRDLLAAVPAVTSTPALAEFERYFERPWLDNLFFQFDAPGENMPCYGREIARIVGNTSLLLMTDLPAADKETLLVRFVQYGIDLWGLVQAGYPGWQAHGGHGNGRKWAILFAGKLLDDPDMLALATAWPEVRFSEDMQTMAGAGWTGANVVYGGHVGPDGESVNPGWGPYEHLPPAEWLGDCIGESYRRCCTSIAWIGQALAARLLGAQDAWGYPPFFDYADRWMTEDDSAAVQQILQDTGHDYTADWARQGQAWDPFVDEMWAAYRSGT